MLALIANNLLAQNTLKLTVKDKETNEVLPGAAIISRALKSPF